MLKNDWFVFIMFLSKMLKHQWGVGNLWHRAAQPHWIVPPNTCLSVKAKNRVKWDRMKIVMKTLCFENLVEETDRELPHPVLRTNTIRRPKISPPKVIYKVQSMPYKSLPLGAFWTIFGQNFPTGVPELLYPYQPANPLVESIFQALLFNSKEKNRAIFGRRSVFFCFCYRINKLCPGVLSAPRKRPEHVREQWRECSGHVPEVSQWTLFYCPGRKVVAGLA